MKCTSSSRYAGARWRIIVMACFGASVTGGCAGGLEMGALSASTSVVETGATMFTRGRVMVFEEASSEIARRAARRTVERLELRIQTEREDDLAHRLHCQDSLGASIKILVQNRTPTVVRIKVDAGLLGNPSFSSLVLVTLRDEIAGQQRSAATKSEQDIGDTPR